MVVIIDFGSQTTHLIERRIKELGVATKIISPPSSLSKIQLFKPKGIILSGGPASVYAKNAPKIDPKIFSLNIPILTICYGFQITTQALGGKVIGGKKEYGPAQLSINNYQLTITKKLPRTFQVWMSHGDEIVKIPTGFKVLGSTEHVPFALAVDESRQIYGLLFHPEVEHTQYGKEILKNFLSICHSGLDPESRKILKRVQNDKAGKNQIDRLINQIKQTVGKSYVIGAVSGGVDSTVAATLVSSAIGNKFIPVYVDNGLMRDGTTLWVEKIFKSLGTKPIIVDTKVEMLKKLRGIIDPEEKRKVIGAFYIEIFERELKRLKLLSFDIRYLMQGTIYSDVIESKGTKHAAKIKSHHNVGGLPKRMKLKLLEPLRHFYKDQVKEIGRSLGLPDEFINKQPFPGPGFAVRIRGEVTKERLEKEKQADKIVLDELEKNGLLDKVFISFPVMTGADSTAVKGDGRFFGEVIALRIVESKDVMTASFAQIPYPILQKISSRIVNEVPGISRVVYDISTKPPATMEWE